MKIYFDNTLINSDYVSSLVKNSSMFTNNAFRIGATICESYTMTVDKSIGNIPSVVELKDSNNNLLKTLYVSNYNDEDSFVYQLELEDAMTKFNFRYDASEIFVDDKTTLGAIFADICEKAEIDTDITTFYNSDMEVNWYDNTYLARNYLSYIAEINGKNFRISNSNKLEFVDINTTPVKTITFDEISDYKIGIEHTITRVVLGDWQYGTTTGETYYVNEDNVYATAEETVENIYNEINGFTYYNFETANCPIDGIDTGDLIAFTDGTNTYKTFTQFNEATYSGGNWFGGITVKLDGEVKQETQVVGEAERYRRIKRIVDQQTGTITQIVEEQNEQGEKITTIEQTVSEIQSAIQDMPVITTEASGTGTIALTNLLHNRLIELHIHPTDRDILGLFASTQLKVAIGLKALSRGVTFDGDEDYYYMIPDNLYFFEDVYDEFIYDGVNQKIKVIHRVGIDENDEKYALDEEVIEEFDYYDIVIGDGDYNILMKTYPTAYIYIKAMIKNDYTTAFATSYEVETKIKQTNKSIELLAEEKVDANDIIASLNVAVEEGRGVINLVGNTVTIDSDNFNLDEEGNMTCNGANIEGGEINLYSTPETTQPKFKIINPNNENQYMEMTSGRLGAFDSNGNVRTSFNYNMGMLGLLTNDGITTFYTGGTIQSQNSNNDAIMTINTSNSTITLRDLNSSNQTILEPGKITITDGTNTKIITPTS